MLIVAKQVRQRSDPSGVDLPGPFGFSPAVEQTFVDPAAIANKNVRQSRLRDNVVGVRLKTCDVTSGWPRQKKAAGAADADAWVRSTALVLAQIN